MTDRPSTAGPMLGATLAGDAGAPGYYPDPSVPGFIRYWAGHAWVPGTSRPAPGPGEPLDPPRFVARYLTAPPYGLPPGLVPAAPAAAGAGPGEAGESLVETGPIYLDETRAQAVFTMPVHPEAVRSEAVRPEAGAGAGAGAAVGGAAESGPGELEVRPRNEMESLRPVEVTPWAVAGNGLQPVAAESWATAAALRLGGGGGAGVPVGAVVAPRKGREARGARSAGEAREVEAAVRPLELAGPAAAVAVEAEPEAVVGAAAVPRAAQPLGGTPWHGAGAGEGVGDGLGSGLGDGSVGLAATPGALFEPVPSAEPAEPAEPVEPVRPSAGPQPEAPSEALSEALSEVLPQPRSADSGSGWRADPRAQRGLMETGGAPRWVSWGVDPEPGAAGAADAAGAVGAPVQEQAPAPAEAPVEAERPGREPRAAHVTSERVRPSRRAGESVPAPAARAAAGAGAAAGAKKRRAGAPAPVPAGVGARALAWLVDGAVTVVVGAAVAVPLAGTVRAHVQEKIDQAALAASMTGRQRQVWLLDGTVLSRVGVLLGVLVVFGLLYQVLPIARTGQTFGKRLARVRVVAAGGTGAPGFGRSLLRWLVRGLGTAVLFGPLAALLDRPARRGWHDRAARTRAVRAERG
ncbi:RDD family protein [Kitasatospora phosalacinea]|uniref:RDD family protein n=1 Tax=Kitasatospora phosalacinea TaxID=2065 RepID=UPI0035D704C3